MNFDEYQSAQFSVYQAFADTVRFILEQALRNDKELPRPQAVQSRAKSIESLRRRLVEEGKLETQTLESERRDLAGARLIFYTNDDVERFLNSALVRENFDIEEESTKVHHPTPENKGSKYRAIHYTVRLREDRTRLPEYKRFAGLRCEIQVQTILNHAYSETSHDIIYKGAIDVDGYGGKAMKAIARRFERIMDEYLIPAGYEIQKAQQEYERLLQGKEIFDKDITRLLGNAKNNNERHELLSALKDYAIPHYDDLSKVHRELRGPLLATARVARDSPRVPIETPYGNFDGFKAEAVIKLVLEIIERLRYADVTGTLQLLIDIYRGEPDDGIRQKIVNMVKNMSEYNINAYNQVGPQLQMALIDHLATMSDAEVDSVRQIAIAVWKEALESDITGTKWRADSMTLSTGAVPASAELGEVRAKAISALFAAYDRSTDDTQRRDILTALDAATRTPYQARYSNELLAVTVKDSTRIVDFMRERAAGTSFELLQHLEHRLHHDYLRAKQLSDDPENRFGCQAEARGLESSILAFRDAVNSDDRFVKYKVLVGFESVYPDQWANPNFDFREAEEYRRREADRYISEIDSASEVDWFTLIERCAATKSNDLATFPVFGNFISNLSERKPEVAQRLLASASDDLRGFLAGFLNGLARSSRQEIYECVLDTELKSAKNLAGIARHLRFSDTKKPSVASAVLARAIEKENVAAVIECLAFSMEHYDVESIAEPNNFVRDALQFLNERKNSYWVHDAWFLQNTSKFYDELTSERVAQILQSMGFLPKINPPAEHILVHLARRWPDAIWEFFGKRLADERTKEREGDSDDERFEAVPFSFHGLERELSKHPKSGINRGLAWFAESCELFQFRGGRLLSAAFSNCTPEFASTLAELVKAGGQTEADFALAILQNYHGETSTHLVLKEIVSRFSEDRRKMSAVKMCIDSTGVVSGEFGFAEAWRQRKQSMIEWLTDERPAVKAFAEKHMKELDLRIAAEHLRAESDKEMRKRDFDEDDDDQQGDDDKGEDQ
jgi:ppGpp synthetase/RelA/SpoT-type nucleotidyltranferase